MGAVHFFLIQFFLLPLVSFYDGVFPTFVLHKEKCSALILNENYMLKKNLQLKKKHKIFTFC